MGWRKFLLLFLGLWTRIIFFRLKDAGFIFRSKDKLMENLNFLLNFFLIFILILLILVHRSSWFKDACFFIFVFDLLDCLSIFIIFLYRRSSSCFGSLSNNFLTFRYIALICFDLLLIFLWYNIVRLLSIFLFF